MQSGDSGQSIMEHDEDNFYSRTVNNCQKLMEKYAHKYMSHVDVSEKARRPKLPSHEVERRCLCAIAHLKDNLDSTYMDVANRYGISDTSLRERLKKYAPWIIEEKLKRLGRK